MEASKLAALLASRICHDLVSPVSSLTTGVDLLNDEMGMRDQAEQLLRSGVETTTSKLTFLRYAFGSVGLQEGAADLHDAKELFSSYFNDLKADLDWRVGGDPLSFGEVRLLMNLAIIVGEGLAWGGTVAVSAEREGDTRVLMARGEADRVDLKAAVSSALAGDEPEGGWTAR
ncbi:MAG: histidine phosphotransferase family protein, partial [Pseudomonadota bacterium]